MSEQTGSFFMPAEEGASSGAAERQALMFVRTWAEEVIRQTDRLKETRESVRAYHRMLGDEPGIDGGVLAGAFREQWAAEHTLLWAAYQLERWRKRLDRERRINEREYDGELLKARNALEHLDTADFVGDRAVAPHWEASKKKKAPQDPYRTLRGMGGLDISIVDDGTFCGIPTAELHERALDVVSSVEEDLAEEVVESLVELMRGR